MKRIALLTSLVALGATLMEPAAWARSKRVADSRIVTPLQTVLPGYEVVVRIIDAPSSPGGTAVVRFQNEAGKDVVTETLSFGNGKTGFAAAPASLFDLGLRLTAARVVLDLDFVDGLTAAQVTVEAVNPSMNLVAATRVLCNPPGRGAALDPIESQPEPGLEAISSAASARRPAPTMDCDGYAIVVPLTSGG